jgi:hypothetical protein
MVSGYLIRVAMKNSHRTSVGLSKNVRENILNHHTPLGINYEPSLSDVKK